MSKTIDQEVIYSYREPKGYVCPRCRLLFQIPDGFAGNGVTCPGCNTLSTIPRLSDNVASLNSYRDKTKPEVAMSRGGVEFKTKEQLEIERLNREHEGKKADSGLIKLIAGVIILITGALMYFLFSGNSKAPIQPKNQLDALVASQIKKSKEHGAQKTTADINFNPDRPEDFEKLENFLKSVFEAKEIKDLLPLVNMSNGQQTAINRFEKFYPDGKVHLGEFSRLHAAKIAQDWNSVLLCDIRMKDQSRQLVAVYIDGENDFKIDWEEMVGYSDMSLPEFLEKKPTEPVLVRVLVNLSDYYNGGFGDDGKYCSAYLAFRGQESGLFGYLVRGDGDEQKLFNFGVRTKGIKATLLISYPKVTEPGFEYRMDNQVRIDSVVNTTWYSRKAD